MEAEPSGLESAMLAFLKASRCAERLQEARALAGGDVLRAPFALQVDVLELAQQDPELAQLLVDDALEFLSVAHAALVAGQLLHPAERLVLQLAPSSLPAQSCGCAEAVDLLRCWPTCTLAVHGVCVAASAVFQQRHSRTFCCNGCGAELVVRKGSPAPQCCGPAFLQEVHARAMMVQNQVLYLSHEPSVAGAGAHLGEPTIAVHVSDGLCGSAHVGDRLLILGVGRHVLSLDAASAIYGCRPVLQMDAVAVEVLPPAAPASRSATSLRGQRPPAQLSGLDDLLGALGCCFDAPCHPLLRLAVLLSAAAAGVQEAGLEAGEGSDSDEEPESWVQRSTCTSRAQVNILLLTAAPEPHLHRLLHAAASTLCQHSVACGTDHKALLPRLYEKFVEPSCGAQVPLALGGQVAEASGGVLLLHSRLKGKHGAALASALLAGSVALAPNAPELAVRLSPSVWCLVEDQDLGKPAGKGVRGATSMRLAAKYGAPFLSLFDIHLDCSSEEADIDVIADQLLGMAQRQQAAMAAACGGADSCTQHHEVAKLECGALAALQAHLRQAAALPPPRMTAEAMALLSGYFSLVRVAEESPQGVLASLARVATACARLCLRRQVLPLPDAVVAVAFMEEQIAARGGYANYWGKWRAELDRCTDLAVCLEGLHDSLRGCLAASFAAGAEE